MPENRETLEDAGLVRRKRLRFRCWHRGSREIDLLLGRFADRHLDALNPSELDQFEALLSESDPDIWDWVVRGVPAPSAMDTPVIKRLRALARGLGDT